MIDILLYLQESALYYLSYWNITSILYEFIFYYYENSYDTTMKIARFISHFFYCWIQKSNSKDRSRIDFVLLSIPALASSAVPKNTRRKPANPPARVAADAERDAEITNTCPDDGFFADAEQCDKYYECR